MTTWLMYAIGNALLFGIAAMLEKIGTKRNSSNAAAALWGIVIAVFSVIILRYTGSVQNISTFGQKSILFMLLAGLALGGSWLCFFRALRTGEVIKIIPVYLVHFPLEMLIRILLFQSSYEVIQIVAMILMFVGTLLIALHADGGEHAGGYIWLIFTLLAAVLAAASTILCEYGVVGVNGHVQDAFVIITALVLVWIVAIAAGSAKTMDKMSFLDGVWVCLAAVAIGASWFCYYQANRTGVVSVVEYINNLKFLAVLPFGCLFLKEKLSLRGVFGTILLVVGGVLMIIRTPGITVFI